MSKQASAKSGPDFSGLDLPTVNARDEQAAVDAAEAKGPQQPTNEVMRTVDEKTGIVVETITSVMQPNVETRAQTKARVKRSYVDARGLTIEEY